jgi:hypothetical protein
VGERSRIGSPEPLINSTLTGLSTTTQHNTTGSGKTHLAKLLRDIEREEKSGCRILCLDDYFLQVCRAWILCTTALSYHGN